MSSADPEAQVEDSPPTDMSRSNQVAEEDDTPLASKRNQSTTAMRKKNAKKNFLQRFGQNLASTGDKRLSVSNVMSSAQQALERKGGAAKGKGKRRQKKNMKKSKANDSKQEMATDENAEIEGKAVPTRRKWKMEVKSDIQRCKEEAAQDRQDAKKCVAQLEQASKKKPM